MRPCMRCKNAIRKGARLAGDVDNYCFDICCQDFARFGAQSDDEARGLWDELAAQVGHLSATEFKKLEVASGFNYHANALLDGRELRSAVRPSSLMYDSMHNLWSNGIIGWEVFAFLGACKRKAG
eukprot:9487398-Pyramimonas_sp.AAC.1